MNSRVVMGIYPNARGFGYAIFEKATDPLMCGTIVVKPMSNKECQKRIEKLIDHFKPRRMVLEDTTDNRHKRARVKKLIDKLILKCTQKNIEIQLKSRAAIQDVFIQFGAVTKLEIADVIVRWLPQYRSKLPGVRKPGHPEDYYQGMFDAMSLVLCHFYLT